jgi:hypothetical protein
MRTKWSVLLPSGQMAVAVALLCLGHRQDAATVGLEYAFVSLPTMLCYAISAPALLFRFCGIHLWNLMRLSNSVSAEVFVDDAVFVLSVGLVWYIVGHEIDLRAQNKTTFMLLPSTFRMVVDLCLLLFGSALGIMGLGSRQYQYGPVLVAIYIMWALVIVVVCSLDLVRVARGKG